MNSTEFLVAFDEITLLETNISSNILELDRVRGDIDRATLQLNHNHKNLDSICEANERHYAALQALREQMYSFRNQVHSLRKDIGRHWPDSIAGVDRVDSFTLVESYKPLRPSKSTLSFVQLDHIRMDNDSNLLMVLGLSKEMRRIKSELKQLTKTLELHYMDYQRLKQVIKRVVKRVSGSRT
jgi:septation ring formation regulator EzrA